MMAKKPIEATKLLKSKEQSKLKKKEQEDQMSSISTVLKQCAQRQHLNFDLNHEYQNYFLNKTLLEKESLPTLEKQMKANPQ